jgi:malonyl-CoA O-methyltransferase
MKSGAELNPGAIRRAFDRASASFDAHDALPALIRDELLARLDLLAFEPDVVLDLGAGTGQGSRALKKRYPRARVIALDVSTRMLERAAKRQLWLRPFARVCADGAHLPLRDCSVDLVYSNLMLHWAPDLDALLGEVRRALTPNGCFTFTTLGPDTLVELRAAWAEVDEMPHVHPFLDMHDIGDALVRNGFGDPVMDVDRHTVTYPDLAALHGELKGLGARNALMTRPRGLARRGMRERLERACDRWRNGDGRLSVSCEVVYGQAWRPGATPPTRSRRGEHVVPLSTLKGRRA